jgi:acyl-CoA reductase-like NAD-dependent aldehyde dehydrogenase
MRTTVITNLGQLEAAYERTEQLMQEAAEAERAAFAQWQHPTAPSRSPVIRRLQPGRIGCRP